MWNSKSSNRINHDPLRPQKQEVQQVDQSACLPPHIEDGADLVAYFNDKQQERLADFAIQGLLSIDLNHHQANLLALAIDEPSNNDFYSMRFKEEVEAKIKKRKLKENRANSPQTSQQRTQSTEIPQQAKASSTQSQTIFDYTLNQNSLFNSELNNQLFNQDSKGTTQRSNLFNFIPNSNQTNFFNSSNTKLPTLDIWGKPIPKPKQTLPTWNELFKPNCSLTQQFSIHKTQRPLQQNPIFQQNLFDQNSTIKQEQIKRQGNDALKVLNREEKKTRIFKSSLFDQTQNTINHSQTIMKVPLNTSNTLQSQNELINDKPEVPIQASPYLHQTPENFSDDIRNQENPPNLTRSKDLNINVEIIQPDQMIVLQSKINIINLEAQDFYSKRTIKILIRKIVVLLEMCRTSKTFENQIQTWKAYRSKIRNKQQLLKMKNILNMIEPNSSRRRRESEERESRHS